jgi:hypothetical protein
MTILWDRDGTRYGRGAGLRVSQDGTQIGHSPTLGPLQVTMATPAPLNRPPRLANLAANPTRTGYPAPIASFTYRGDNAWDALDGNIWYDDRPNSRWTAYTTPNPSDWLGVDFGGPRAINEVRLYIYDGGGGVQAPAGYTVQYWNGGAWVDATGQVKTPAAPRGRDLNVVRFDHVVTNQVRVVFTHPPGSTSGVTEFEVWNTHDAPSTGVVFFEHADYLGNASTIKGAGDYPALPGDMPNETMSSLKIPAGWTVEAYTHGGFGGPVCTFTSSTTRVGQDCNDRMSSFRIRAG